MIAYIGIVQSGLNFNVFRTEPHGVVVEIPSDGKWHPGMKVGWLEFRLHPGKTRIAIAHHDMVDMSCIDRSTKLVLDDASGRKSMPWHAAAFSCRENAERWIEETVAHYQRYYDFEQQNGKVFYDYFEYQHQAAKGTPPKDALYLAEREAWSRAKDHLDFVFEDALERMEDDPSDDEDDGGEDEGETTMPQALKNRPDLEVLYLAFKAGRDVDAVAYLHLVRDGVEPERAIALAEAA